MSMLQITGQVINVFERPPTVRNGEEVIAKPQVQLMGSVMLPNGQSRVELVTLSTDNPEVFKQYQDQMVSVPVAVFSPNKGSIIYFIPKGSKPKKNS